jgi:Ca2+-dependent lipid-binding protein
VWNEQFTIDVKYIGDDFYVKVFDEDVTENEAIGATMMKMSAVCR